MNYSQELLAQPLALDYLGNCWHSFTRGLDSNRLTGGIAGIGLLWKLDGNRLTGGIAGIGLLEELDSNRPTEGRFTRGTRKQQARYCLHRLTRGIGWQQAY